LLTALWSHGKACCRYAAGIPWDAPKTTCAVRVFLFLAIRPDAAAAVARFGLAAAITTGASFTILQAVDGVALKRVVDAWASAPSDQQAAALAAAEAIRWIEIGVNSLSFSLV